MAAGSTAIGAAGAALGGYSGSYIPAAGIPYQIAVNSATDTVYLISPQVNDVFVIDGATRQVTATLTLSGDAQEVAVDPATDRVYVSERVGTAGAVAVLDGSTNAVIATVSLSAKATGIAVDTATDTIYAATESGIVVIDGATSEVSATISTTADVDPTAIAVDQSRDLIWVAGQHGAILRIDGATNKITATGQTGGALAETLSIAVDPANDNVYDADFHGRDVAVINGATAAVTTTMTFPALLAVAFDPVAGIVLASTNSSGRFGATWVIDPGTDAITDTLTRGGSDMAVDSATDTTYVANNSIEDGGAWVLTPAATNSASPVLPFNSLTFQAGQAGSHAIQVDADPAPVVALTSGKLPAGLTLSPDGTVAGTPATGSGGVYKVAVTASNGVAPDASEQLNIYVDEKPAITSADSTTFRVGDEGSFPLTYRAGYPALDYFTLTNAPPWLYFVTDGQGSFNLTGGPPAGSGGVYHFTINSWDGSQATPLQSFTLTVLEVPAITSASHATFRAGTAGRFTVTANGYPVPTFTEAGRLPHGVTLSQTGVLAGKPAAGTGGSYRITLTAKNSVGSSGASGFELTVDQAVAFTSARRATFTAGKRHSFTFRTTGFPAATLSERGHLPNGVTFKTGKQGTASLTGNPARDARGKTYVITITARNSAGSIARQTFRLKIT